MANKKESFFWTSYSDLMTSLFFIMMVLFVLVMVLLYKRMQVTQDKLDEIIRIEQSTKDLSKQYFAYNEKYEKYVLKVQVFFPELKSDFKELPDSTRGQLRAAGMSVDSFLLRHNDNKYLLIVEGQASMNGPKWMDRNYELSFERAKNLIKFWQGDCRLNFPNNVEIQIAGSGDGRLNKNSMRDPVEKKNQRFLIHIIPKNIFKE